MSGMLCGKGTVAFSHLHSKQGLTTTPEPQGSTGAGRGRAGVQLHPHIEKNTQELWQPTKSLGKRAGRRAGITEKPPGYQSSQKESEINKMEAMALGKYNKCREMVDKIPREATARNKRFLEGWWFFNKKKKTGLKGKTPPV